MKRIVPGISSLLFLTLLAACTQGPAPTPQPDGAAVSGVHYIDGSDPVFALALAMVDTDWVPPPTPLSVTPVGRGGYIGPVTAYTAGEELVVAYPAAADVPAETLSPPTSFVTVLDQPCTTNATNATARVSELEWFFYSTPGIAGFGVAGLSPALVSDTSLAGMTSESDIFDRPLIAWVYASANTNVSTATAGCMVGTLPVHVDLTLEQGWNQLEFVVHSDPADPTNASHLSLENSDLEELHLTFQAGLS